MPDIGVQITTEHLRRYEELRAAGNGYLQAAAIVKDEFALPHKALTIYQRCKDMRTLQDTIPDIGAPLPKELVVPYRDCMIMGDVHAPYIHKLALVDALTRARDEGIDTLVLNGDFLDMDWCSHYMSLSAPGTLADVEMHRDAVYRILLAMVGVFGQIYVVKGNHDDRMMKALQKRLGMDHIWRIFTTPPGDSDLPNIFHKFTVTERSYMVMQDSPTGHWRFSHQKNYSMIAGRVPTRLAGKVECNVVCAHTHHLNLGDSGTHGQYFAVEGGCMFDPKKIEYKNIRDTLHPLSRVGYVTIRGGVPQIHPYMGGGHE